jgi:hypothetical protein
VIVNQAVIRFMYNTAMRLTMGRRLSGILLLAISLVLLTWGLIPEQMVVRPIEIAPEEMALPGASAEMLPEARVLRLSWPKTLRAGDAGSLRLSVDLAAGQNEREIVVESPAGEVGVGSAGLNTAYRTVLQAHLDLPGVAFSPTGEISQALVPTQNANFLWNLRAREAGNYPGKAWLHLQQSQLTSGSPYRAVLTAQQFEIEVEEFLGLNGVQARVIGSLGLVIGALVGLDGVVKWLNNWIVKHRRER